MKSIKVSLPVVAVVLFSVFIAAAGVVVFKIIGDKPASSEELVRASLASPCARDYLSRIVDEKIITAKDVMQAYGECQTPETEQDIHLSQKQTLQNISSISDKSH